ELPRVKSMASATISVPICGKPWIWFRIRSTFSSPTTRILLGFIFNRIKGYPGQQLLDQGTVEHSQLFRQAIGCAAGHPIGGDLAQGEVAGHGMGDPRREAVATSHCAFDVLDLHVGVDRLPLITEAEAVLPPGEGQQLHPAV